MSHTCGTPQMLSGHLTPAATSHRSSHLNPLSAAACRYIVNMDQETELVSIIDIESDHSELSEPEDTEQSDHADSNDEPDYQGVIQGYMFEPIADQQSQASQASNSQILQDQENDRSGMDPAQWYVQFINIVILLSHHS